MPVPHPRRERVPDVRRTMRSLFLSVCEWHIARAVQQRPDMLKQRREILPDGVPDDIPSNVEVVVHDLLRMPRS